MKLEEVIKNLSTQYEAKVKQVNQLSEALEKAKAELLQLTGAYQLAVELKQEEDKDKQSIAGELDSSIGQVAPTKEGTLGKTEAE